MLISSASIESVGHKVFKRKLISISSGLLVFIASGGEIEDQATSEERRAMRHAK
jgi:hypothetical protein